MQYTLLAVGDDSPLYVVRRDLSGGMNTRQGENVIQENQATLLQNVSLDVAGERSVRKGVTLIEDLGNTAGTSLFGFEPEGGTNELIANSGQFLKWWSGSGSFGSIASLASIGFDLPMNMVTAIESDQGDVVIMQNGTNNAVRLEPTTPAFQDLGDTNTSPPKSTVMTYYRDRLWVLDAEKTYYSGAVPSDYSNTFNRSSNYYNTFVGDARALLGTRDYGLLVFGSKSICAVDPAVTPAPATDKVDSVLNVGCAAGNTVKQVGDDFFFLSYDGVRGIFRTINDKLQTGQSYAISYPLKDEFDEINWSYISKADAIFWDNKYIITLPTGSSTYNNKMWVYYPAYKAWVVITGLNIARFASLKVSGEERLYGIEANDGKVHRLFYGDTDNGTNIIYQEEGRAEDFGQPLKKKLGGELKLKVRGEGCTIVPYVSVDGSGYQGFDEDPIVLEEGGLDFDFDFPFNFGETETTGIFHLDKFGSFNTVKFKFYCSSNSTLMKIMESLAVTFLEEYQAEG